MQASSKNSPIDQIRHTKLDHPEYRDHECVVFGSDPEAGLSTIIAIHDTRLGPALGGCRMMPYSSVDEALTDALRLSHGMTYKNALAGLDFGGGKAVIIGDPGKHKSAGLMAAFGRQVDSLGGAYITGEDVGLTPADMELIGAETNHVRGTSRSHRGDPSPYTALGVYHGMLAAIEHAFGDRKLRGRIVSLQGLGNVGYSLARHLDRAGARLVVSDINNEAVERAVREFGAEWVDPQRAHRVQADIFAPCALGAGLNDDTIPDLAAPIVAGSANNQLAETRHGAALLDRSILYAPDYVINAGGVMALAKPDVSDAVLEADVKKIESTLAAIFVRAEEEKLSTRDVADHIAEERLAAAVRRR
jgi:leucine dehydrogenase